MSARRAVLAALAFLFAACATGASAPEITVQDLKAKRDRKEKFVLLDVREPKEYALAKIEGSTLIPLGELPGRLGELDKSVKLVVHCKAGAEVLT